MNINQYHSCLNSLIENLYFVQAFFNVHPGVNNLSKINISKYNAAEFIELFIRMIRKLDKRWSSCTKIGNIVVNADLIKAPINCIDYVMIHEICHLKHHDHGNKFWMLLNKYCPDWVELKNKLESFPL